MDMNMNEIEGAIEAVLFASGEPVGTVRLCAATDCDTDTIKKIIQSMNDKYNSDLRGIIIKKIEDAYQLCTNAKYTEHIRRSLNLDKKTPLSQTLLETLAIIAYMQPVTKQQIVDIRGVDANHSVNKLMEKGLICEKGRLDVPGRPLLFGTTDEFLRNFGFGSINEMPLTMRKIEQSTKL